MNARSAVAASSAARRLELNVLSIEVPDTTVVAELLPYENKDNYDDIRRAHLGSHVFVRRRGSMILAVPIAEEAPGLDGEPAEISLPEDLKLAAILWREGMLRSVLALDRTIIRGKPLQFVSTTDEDDVAAAAFRGRFAAARDVIQARIAYRFDPRVFYPVDGERYLGVVVGVDTVQRFAQSVARLVEANMDVRGMYAGERVPLWDARIEPELRVRGRIVEVRGTRVIVDDPRTGRAELDAATCYPEASRENRERALSHILRGDAQAASSRLWWGIVATRDGASWHQRLDRLTSYVQKSPVEILPGIVATAGERVMPQASPGARVRVFESAKPVYVFDAAGRRTELKNSTGIAKHGPYSRSAPLPRSPRVCVVCQASEQGAVEKFLFKFLNGIDSTVFSRGFLRTYGLDECAPEVFPASNGSATAYRQAAQQAMQKARDEGFEWDCAFVQVFDATHQMRGDDNPYLVTKAFFLGNQIPVQQFRIETTEMPSGQLAFAVSNMALATYSKLGGIPWVLRADPTTTHELVFGISSSWVRDSRLVQGERLVGITTVFTGDGNYCLHTVTKAVPFDDYQVALEESLRGALDRVRKERNWLPGERLRLVFHAFKPMKNCEASAVKELVSKLVDFEVEFAFVHVAEDVPYQMFDLASSGQRSRGGVRGRFAPDRGLLVQLSDRLMLVTTVGPAELKRPSDGCPTPIALHLHGASTFTDLRYLGEQALIFSGHSWRGFQPATVPVTIAYSKLIARHLARLASTSRWNPDVLYGRIGTSRWFL